MMTIKKEKLIKKVIGIMVFIMAMITIITNPSIFFGGRYFFCSRY